MNDTDRASSTTQLPSSRRGRVFVDGGGGTVAEFSTDASRFWVIVISPFCVCVCMCRERERERDRETSGLRPAGQ